MSPEIIAILGVGVAIVGGALPHSSFDSTPRFATMSASFAAISRICATGCPGSKGSSRVSATPSPAAAPPPRQTEPRHPSRRMSRGESPRRYRSPSSEALQGA